MRMWDERREFTFGFIYLCCLTISYRIRVQFAIIQTDVYF